MLLRLTHEPSILTLMRPWVRNNRGPKTVVKLYDPADNPTGACRVPQTNGHPDPRAFISFEMKPVHFYTCIRPSAFDTAFSVRL
jgi:hypothetical protein